MYDTFPKETAVEDIIAEKLVTLLRLVPTTPGCDPAEACTHDPWVISLIDGKRQ